MSLSPVSVIVYAGITVLLLVFRVGREWRATRRLGMRSAFALLAIGMFGASLLLCPLGWKSPAPWADSACGDVRAWTSLTLQALGLICTYLGLQLRIRVTSSRWDDTLRGRYR